MESRAEAPLDGSAGFRKAGSGHGDGRASGDRGRLFTRGRSARTGVPSCVGLLSLCVAAGCQQPLKPIFEARAEPIAWPPPPASARIEYVGQISSAADLKPRRKALQGLVDLLVGSEPPARLYGPRAVVCTADGQRLWIADPGGRCVHLFDLATREYRKITRVGDTPLLTPVGVCLGPNNSIYVCDSESVAIHRISDRTGERIETLRLVSDILRPAAVYFEPDERALYVVDVSGHDIKVLSPDGRLLRILGRRGNAPGEFNFPSGITSDGQYLWIADTGNHRVQAVTRDGVPVADFGQVGDGPGDLAMPKAVALDRDGHLHVVDARFENVQVFDTEGRVLLFFGEEGTGPGAFWLPGGIFIDHQDRIWVCDSYNRRVQVFHYVADTREGEEGNRP